MGCGSSKEGGLNHVDDSVHVMLKHDSKRQMRMGQPVRSYKERAAHPLLRPKETGNDSTPSAPETTTSGSFKERAPHPLLKPKEEESNQAPPAADNTSNNGSESAQKAGGVIATEEE
eukprot:jgi/Psemu1/305595/fgenesh1_kg.207_\